MTSWTTSCFLAVTAVSCLSVLGSTAASAAQQIGVSAAVRGDVRLIPPGETGRQATSGEPVNFMETVQSGKDSGLQVLLLDETTFTLGPDSEIIIDEMVFDPEGQDSKLMVTVAQGAFRYLSGDIAKQNPKNVSISTPMGNIGIRGTNLFAVETGGQWFFGLLGPGPNNNTGDKPGGFVFTNNQGAADVRRPGYGFTVTPGQAPSAVGPIPPEVFLQFAAAMTEQGGETGDDTGGDTGGDTPPTADAPPPGDAPPTADEAAGGFAAAADESGQTDAVTLVTVAVQQAVAMVQQTTTAAATSSGQAIDTVTATLPDSYVLSPLTYADVRGYTGSANYIDTGVQMFDGAFPCPAGCNGGITAEELQAGFDLLTQLNAHGTPVGSYDFALTANFSNRTVTGDYTNIAVDASVAGTAINVASLPFNISYDHLTGTFDPTVANVASGVSGYDLSPGFTFLKSTGSQPFLAQALMVQTNPGGTDVAFGGSVIAPK